MDAASSAGWTVATPIAAGAAVALGILAFKNEEADLGLSAEVPIEAIYEEFERFYTATIGAVVKLHTDRL